METQKAILVVSFGTSYNETRKKTIDQIEADIQAAFPEHRVYRAWTSSMICRKVLNRDGIHIMNVKEALEQMQQDGMKEIIVQPTHVLNGIENDQMLEDVMSADVKFEKICIGSPLLSSQEDKDTLINVIAKMNQVQEDEALILMGHGTEHYANSVYAALDYQFADQGMKNIMIGTVEAYPGIKSLLKRVKNQGIKKLILAPMMIVAGDHATNDLAGEEEDSWKSQFEAAGYEVTCRLMGLGEYPGVRRMFVDHVKEAMQAEE